MIFKIKHSYFLAILATLIISASFVALNSPFANPSNVGYTIYIDAGSTKSEIHLFQYIFDKKNKAPAVTEIFSESTKPGLSSFSHKAQYAGTTLKKLLDDVAKELQSRGVTTRVPVNVLATAGMRLLLNEQQKEIYNSVEKFITKNYTSTYKLGDVETITGEMEGIYAWLSINYLSGNFQNHQPTLGAIDMGGVSTQLTFETNNPEVKSQLVTIIINNQPYQVFSTSFLGLGLNQSRAAMNNGELNTSCYPKGYVMKDGKIGNFDFSSCDSNYGKIFSESFIKEKVPLLTGKFLAFSGAYYSYQFFISNLISDQLIFKDKIKAVCALSWKKLQQQYIEDQPEYLSNNCADAVYIYHLIYNSYHLSDDQIIINIYVNNNKINWALGAALYNLIE